MSLEEWGITNRVSTLCFDTTAANTGRHSGACTIIEQKLGRTLLFLARRHHIAELVVVAAFELTSDASTGPEVLLYKRFRKYWKNIDQNNFKPGSTHDQWRIQGGQIRPWPPIEVGNEVCPLGGRKSNDSIVNLCKSKDFGGPRIDVGYGFGPLRKHTTLKH